MALDRGSSCDVAKSRPAELKPGRWEPRGSKPALLRGQIDDSGKVQWHGGDIIAGFRTLQNSRRRAVRERMVVKRKGRTGLPGLTILKRTQKITKNTNVLILSPPHPQNTSPPPFTSPPSSRPPPRSASASAPSVQQAPRLRRATKKQSAHPSPFASRLWTCKTESAPNLARLRSKKLGGRFAPWSAPGSFGLPPRILPASVEPIRILTSTRLMRVASYSSDTARLLPHHDIGSKPGPRTAQNVFWLVIHTVLARPLSDPPWPSALALAEMRIVIGLPRIANSRSVYFDVPEQNTSSTAAHACQRGASGGVFVEKELRIRPRERSAAANAILEVYTVCVGLVIGSGLSSLLPPRPPGRDDPRRLAGNVHRAQRSSPFDSAGGSTGVPQTAQLSSPRKNAVHDVFASC
ncbi:hypothetical protein DFH06DRAFT_1131919 [Mycena polygramma]|nr:hypothetical protein DFH06DRAFT_1131919 [Mycena polygramma]